MTGRFRPTVRLRLTVTYTLLFLVVGSLLIALMYTMLSQTLQPPKPKDDGGEKPPIAYTTPSAEQGDEAFPQTKEEYDEKMKAARAEERESALRSVKITAGIALVVTSLAAIGVGWFFAGRMLSPVSQMTRFAARASESTLDQRLRLQGPDDELTQLGRTVDAMLERLQGAFESQRRFAAQASHELRTPLAIVAAEVDVALADPGLDGEARAGYERIRHQVDRSERLIASLLTLSRSEQGVLTHVDLDLADLVGDVLGEHIDEADAAGLKVDLALESAPVRGDEALLRSLASNMIVNAIRYNVPSGFIEVTVRTDGQRGIVEVENSGKVIDPEDLERLFQPYQRGLEGRSRKQGGFGLGLAVIRSVTAAHGGQVSAEARPSGGLVVQASVPLTQ